MKQVIEFHCDNTVVKRNCPVLPANKFIPNWYKELSEIPEGSSESFFTRLFESYHKPVETLKTNLPVSDYINSGYIIPWTHQVIFKKVFLDKNTREEVSNKEDSIKSFKFFSSGSNYIGWHDINEMPILNSYLFKVFPNWSVKTSKGYSCMFFQPYYHFEDRYSILPTIVDTDRFHNVTFTGHLLKDQFTINPNEPLVCVLPFKRDDFSSKIKDKVEKNTIFDLYFQNQYKLFGWNKKKYQ